MAESFPLVVLVFSIALGFGVANGFNDAANAIATVISTRVLSPYAAVLLAAALNLVGAMTGTEVAQTIGKGIIMSEALSFSMVFAGTASGTIWTVGATYFGMPISVSHSLIAGLVGAGLAGGGTGVIKWPVLFKVMSAVAVAPLLGFLGGLISTVGLIWAFHRSPPVRMRTIFSRLQILSSAFMAYSHGKNDGQMPMGLMAMVLMVYYRWDSFYVPPPVMIASAISISLGTLAGGWRVIRTVGTRIAKLDPMDGFAATASAAAVIEAASNLGIPVSTTHSIAGSIMGVGATKRLSAVRWGVARGIVIAWVLTFPVCIALGWFLEMALRSIL